ncbi:hypothetical protein AGLY_012559 [Aphis glycines]|uniref:Uncharacterized protein n=1 Tax=Aphis glycines TaxID=307491 RepID=A0A6G0T8Q8_APHGL|nr:hypothetical protein AGLY_012559 [Aphis glycines]
MQVRHVIGLILFLAAVPLQMYLIKYNQNFKDLTLEIVKNLPDGLLQLSNFVAEYVWVAKNYLHSTYEYLGLSESLEDDSIEDQEIPENLIRNFRPPHVEFRIGNDLTKEPEYFHGLSWNLECLVFFTTFAFSFDGVHANLFVILLESSQIFTSFREFSFFHTFSNIPMDESTFGIHQVKLVVQSSPSFSNSCGVGQHANSTLYFGQITTRYHSWRLVIDTNFETSWTPVNKLNGPLGFDGSNGSIDILGDDITTVQHATSHVFAMTWVTFHHLVGWFKTSVGDF